MVRSELSKDRDFITMFLNEARLTASLDHPGVGQVFDVGESNGRYYLAMEFIRGETLRQVGRACRERSVPLPLDKVLFVFCRVCEALQFIHTHTPPVIHRDISPQNIMLSYDGAVKLIDFGIAKTRAWAEEESTQMGIIKGKLGYLSPEQVRGEPLTGQTDIFSLGIVLWETLTGKRLFRRPEPLLTLQAVVEAAIPDPRSLRPDVPPELSDCVSRALARSLSERYPSAMDMLLDLEKVAVARKLHSSQLALGQFLRGLMPERVASLQRALSAEQQTTNLEKQFFNDLHFDMGGDVDSVPPQEAQETVSLPAGAPTAPPAAKLPIPGPPTLLNLEQILEGPDALDLARRRQGRALGWNTAGWILLGVLAVAVLAGAWHWHRTWQRTVAGATTERGLGASLKIITVPAGAQVWIDGKLRPGKTPLVIPDLESEREYLVRVRLHGRPDWSGNVTLQVGESRELKIKL